MSDGKDLYYEQFLKVTHHVGNSNERDRPTMQFSPRNHKWEIPTAWKIASRLSSTPLSVRPTVSQPLGTRWYKGSLPFFRGESQEK